MAGLRAISCGDGPLGERNPAVNMIHRTAAFASTAAAFAFGPWQIVTPRIIVGTRDLCGDEAINRFVADVTVLILGNPTGDGLWRPALSKPFQHEGLQ